MIKPEVRQAIFTLKERGLGPRAIARALSVSRNTVRAALEEGQSGPEASVSPPAVFRESPHLEDVVRRLFKECKGFVQRVVERLDEEHNIEAPYSTMTRYIRHLGLRDKEGHAHPVILTGPGIEMQHDTSPIDVLIQGKSQPLHLAELICGFSRHRYMEFFPRWTRFHLKIFMVRGLKFLGGSCGRVMVDNARVIIILGAGPDGVVSEEMRRLGLHFDFEWVAVVKGHKDRQGKVEKAHQYVQTNFLPGRTFASLADLNAQLAAWCERIFHRPVRGQNFAPADRWPEEQLHLRPLPEYLPTYDHLWTHKVDDYGFIPLHGSRYSAPEKLVGQWLTVRETADHVILLWRRQELCRHTRYPECEPGQSVLPGHRVRRRRHPPRQGPSSEELHLRSIGPAVDVYVTALLARPTTFWYMRLRRLYRLSCNYPTDVFVSTLVVALERRAFDLDQIERILEDRTGHRVLAGRLSSDIALEERPAYRLGQVTPHRLRSSPTRPKDSPHQQTLWEITPTQPSDHSDTPPMKEDERREPEGTPGGTPQATTNAGQSGDRTLDSEGGPESQPKSLLVDRPDARTRGQGPTSADNQQQTATRSASGDMDD